ncbi:D-glycero-alpha-D-manno-heptose-1,7-bisphosphate 7-phosphatase [Glaciecola petra]|uniref:D,D-heptose 1,7-bisphosphate phosphatase n=1 Tax=Glaciecola petra TaxID=3075602 RepID=A0ABU2ZP80_9ALTE|nr:HAD family hydrolase [Aestuariibacter sp. P117]MDT0594433.1 HAD family hydrolase [Aestuariibacter sp. P117]
MQIQKSALFLDRDGVINVNHGYVFKKENFSWIDGIFDLVKQANKANMLVFVVTNQSGIGRGYYSETEFTLLNTWMVSEFKRSGGHIDKVYWCPHHPEHAVGDYRKVCECRKPKTGMIEQALNEFAINLSSSVMVGDKASDMYTAINAELGRAYWLGAHESDMHELADQEHQKTIIQPIQALSNIRLSTVR